VAAFSVSVPLISPVTTGMSLVFITVSSKSLLTLAFDKSVAVTRTSSDATSSFNGVPLKVRVDALKLNQSGKTSPLLKLAL